MEHKVKVRKKLALMTADTKAVMIKTACFMLWFKSFLCDSKNASAYVKKFSSGGPRVHLTEIGFAHSQIQVLLDHWNSLMHH